VTAMEPRDWSDLSADEQLALREAYGNGPDCLTGTCLLDRKVAHFSDWLARRQVHFGPEHMPGRR
jgi:hypothetical protein